MQTREAILDSIPDTEAPPASRWPDRPVLDAVILGFLTAAGILLLIYNENRALQSGIESMETWSAYQVRILQSTIEEDPNLKQQYTEEEDVLRRHAQDLKQASKHTRRAVTISAFAALILLSGAAAAFTGLFAKNVYAGYVGLLLGIVGVGLSIGALF